MKIDQKVFISTSSFGVVDKKPLDLLKKNRIEHVLNPLGRTLTPEELISFLKGIPYLIAGTEKITTNVLEACPNLRCISRCGVGIDNIDLEAAKRLKIPIASTPEAPTRSAAELTLGLMINVLRSIPEADRRIRQGQWIKPMGRLLSEKKIGIVGFGRIGRCLAELLKPFKVDILVYDIVKDKRIMGRKDIRYVPLAKLFKESDIITIHLPYSPEVHHLIGPHEFRTMKKDAVIINAARGGIVDENSLYQALCEKRIRAAAMDVFEHEPYHGPLKELDNVVLTPHIGSYTYESRREMELQAVENLLNLIKNRR